jgi:hypothetical protein
MTGNIQGANGYSLLHAAVSLGDDPSLIDDLLALGADPKLKSSKNESAMKMAYAHYEKASENEKVHEARIANRDSSADEEDGLSHEVIPSAVSEEDRLRKEKQKTKSGIMKLIWEKLKNHLPVNGHTSVGNDCLPLLSMGEWARPPAGETMCTFGDGCERIGVGCDYWHARRSFVPPEILNFTDPTEANLQKSDVQWTDEDGWWTCAYQDIPSKTIIYTQGGPTAKMNSQGVFWYNDRDDARQALARTVICLIKQRLSSQGEIQRTGISRDDVWSGGRESHQADVNRAPINLESQKNSFNRAHAQPDSCEREIANANRARGSFGGHESRITDFDPGHGPSGGRGGTHNDRDHNGRYGGGGGRHNKSRGGGGGRGHRGRGYQSGRGRGRGRVYRPGRGGGRGRGSGRGHQPQPGREVGLNLSSHVGRNGYYGHG